MITRVIKIDPRKLNLLKLNARYMRHEVFMRLVENVKHDGALTQIPFAALWQYEDADDEIQRDEEGNPIYEVLSGNHRVKAAISAGLDVIDVQVTDEPLSPPQRLAIQLSHNEVVGEDDPTLIKTLYDSIDDVGWRLYSGLDDKKLELLDKVDVDTLSEANLQFQPVSLVFLPEEIEQVHEIWDIAKKHVAGSKAKWLARWTEYDATLDALEATSRAYGVRNMATALMLILDIFTRHLDDLTEGWIDPRDAKGRGQVPLSTILGSGLIPPKAGAVVKKALDKMVGRKEVKAGQRWQALEQWAQAYLDE